MKHAKKLFAVLLAVLMVASMACGSGGSGSGSGSNGSAEGSDGAANQTGRYRTSHRSCGYLRQRCEERHGNRCRRKSTLWAASSSNSVIRMTNTMQKKSVNAYNKLKDWGMQILLGTVTTSPCVAVSQESYNDRIFTLTPSASSNDVIGGLEDADGNVTIPRKDNVFQMCFTDPNQGTASAQIYPANRNWVRRSLLFTTIPTPIPQAFTKFAAEAKRSQSQCCECYDVYRRYGKRFLRSAERSEECRRRSDLPADLLHSCISDHEAGGQHGI